MSRKFPLGLSVLILGLMITASASGATYYIASNGSDSNAGTSQSAPWAHLPGMGTWTGTHTPVAGDTFILRGCDVWGNSNFPIQWNWSGSGSSPIVIDRDTTWYNPTNCPNAWNRAIFNADGAVMGGTECSGLNQFVKFSSVNYVTMKWIELTGYYWNANAGGSCGYDHTGILVEASNSDYVTVDSWYIHNWGHGSSAGDSDHFWYLTGSTRCAHCLFTNGIVNNTDSAVCGSTRCGGGWEWSTTNSVFNWMVNELKPYTQGTFCGNNLSGTGHGFDGTHENIIEPVGGSTGPNYYYFCNNYIHDNSSGELQFGNTGDVYYIWNNVDVQGSNVRTWAFPQQPGANMHLNFWNNTIVPSAGGPAILTCDSCNPATWASVNIENNYVITASTSGSVPTQPGLIGCSPNDCGTNPFPTSGSRTIANNVISTPANASNQGFTGSSLYVYSPQSGNCNGIATNCPIGAGVDLSSLWPSNFSSSDTTYACVQAVVNTVVQSVCNQRTPIARPVSGPWDVGAYEFSSGSAGTPPNPPSALAAVVN